MDVRKNPSEKSTAIQKQAYGRISSVVNKIKKDLDFLDFAKQNLRNMPTIDFEAVTIVIAGFPNVGKSTLLKTLVGALPSLGGSFMLGHQVDIGYFDQQMAQYQSNKTVLDEFWDEYPTLDQTEVRSSLGAFMFTQEEVFKTVDMLSGGEKVRLALCKIFKTKPNVLVLDEPTNHLDMEMVEWLEEYLSRLTGSLLMVTHDRYFLDNVCNEIIEIDDNRIYRYKGNYSYFLQKREERLQNLAAETARARNLLRTELEWMRRQPQARAHKAKYRIDAFYKLEEKAAAMRDDSKVSLEVKSQYIGNKIFVMKGLSKAFDDKVITKDFTYTFARYEKLGIVGNNGTGKSTFIKMLLGRVAPDNGIIEVGETVKWGYYSQDGLAFDEQMKVIDVVKNIAEVIPVAGKMLTASQFLQHFLFSPEKQYSYVYKLSGGEKRRLYLCTVLMSNPNFLVLDEPTNDLDIETLQVLEEYLCDFKGCVIVVSHDRYFMDKVVDHLLVFKGQGDIRDFPGNYSDYRDWKEAKEQHDKAMEKPKEEKTVRVRQNDRRKMTFKEKKEFEELEALIAKLEQEKSDIETALCSGTLSVDELTEKSKRLPELNDLIDEKTMRWLELSEIEG